MWIQVRTMDGKETHRVDSLSKLTKVDELRLKIMELFKVEPERQRLFYRGKQVRGQVLCPSAVHGGIHLMSSSSPVALEYFTNLSSDLNVSFGSLLMKVHTPAGKSTT